jgi:hypothetical protein
MAIALPCRHPGAVMLGSETNDRALVVRTQGNNFIIVVYVNVN